MPDHGRQRLQRRGQAAKLFVPEAVPMNGFAPLRPQRLGNDRGIEAAGRRGLRLFPRCILIGTQAERCIGRRGLRGPLQQVEEAEDFLVTDAGRRDQLVERLPQKLAQRPVEKRNRKSPISRQYPIRKGLIEPAIIGPID